jgi:hypothetical protein
MTVGLCRDRHGRRSRFSCVEAIAMQHSRKSWRGFRLTSVAPFPTDYRIPRARSSNTCVLYSGTCDYALQLIDRTENSAKTLRWPRNFWTGKQASPRNDNWERSVRSILEDRNSFEALIDEAADERFVTPSGPRNRKTLARLALQTADHNSYHIGQLVIIRRLLGCWKR